MWFLLVIVLVGIVAVFVLEGQWVGAGLYLVFVLFLAWWSAPFRGRNTLSHAEVTSRKDPPVVIYWRPGCMYCAGLRRRLGQARNRATWINIYRDADAAAFVRSVNSGNETVPTVVTDAHVRTNPPAAEVREALLARR